MEYDVVERDFVLRSMKIVEQYERYVLPQVNKEEQYDVTLLLNCLLGLIVLPFEHSKRKQSNMEYPVLFKGDDTPINRLKPEWGLSDLRIDCFNINGNAITGDDITVRYIIAMFRHSMAHSQFGDGGEMEIPNGVSVDYKPAEYNAIESVILSVNINNKYKQKVEFRAGIPVASLKRFAMSFAKAFLSKSI